MDIILLLIPLSAAIFVGKDAKQRGMNPIGWGIGVFLLLIIFLPIYLMVRKPLLSEDGQETRVVEVEPSDQGNMTLFYLGIGWILLSGFIFKIIYSFEISSNLELFYRVNSVLWSFVPLALSTAIRDKQMRTVFMALGAIYLVLDLYQVLIEQF